ncbi:hypothetical protein HAX54_047450 [Datura stramonium]|uniref:Uncharacterized protein n=1 Tax=Datura stramonium TaxID=4076 RepID=A0ABS8WKK4_DATST|nr:hypothetical protein [Datura stramonium]
MQNARKAHKANLWCFIFRIADHGTRGLKNFAPMDRDLRTTTDDDSNDDEDEAAGDDSGSGGTAALFCSGHSSRKSEDPNQNFRGPIIECYSWIFIILYTFNV